MAQYWLDLTTDPRSDAEIGALFTVIQAAGGSTFGVVNDGGARALQLVRASGTAAAGVYLTTLGLSITDADIVAVLREDLVAATAQAGIAARSSNPSALLSAYGAVATGATSTQLQSWVASGAQGTSLSAATSPVTLSAYHYSRLQVTGTTVREKRWAGTRGDEPGAWLHSVTDSSLTAGGVGFAHRGGSSNTGRLHCTQLAIGTDGDPAPTGPAGGRQRSRLILTPW